MEATALSVSRSPREEGELEDGEICDDDTEERRPLRRGDGSRPGGRAAPQRPRKPHHMLPHADFRRLLPYGLASFSPGHRPQCGPSGPDRPASPAPPPGEPSPRSSFWERSHGALGRFRHRALPNGGRGAGGRGAGGRGAWGRGRGSGSRAAAGRYGLGEAHGTRTESPSRKQKLLGRNQVRKAAHCVSKAENCVDESFEDLLSKYKQIQLELECIRKEETMVLGPRGDIPDNTASITETRPVPEATQSPDGPEDTSELETVEKKVFQAFNLKPLRQKLPTPAQLDELKRHRGEDDSGGGGAEEQEEESKEENGGETELRPEAATEEKVCESSASSGESAISPDKQPVVKVKVEEEELSELQLRLLALQSASKKWQQKEQQVMKKSKDRITRAAQEKKCGSSPAGRVTTRSTSSVAAVEQNQARSKPPDRERDKTRSGPRLADRERLPERSRPKQSPKAPKAVQDRGRTPGKLPLTRKLMSSGSATKQAFRKQQLRTWKLQQQRQQEENRRHDEEERRKREEEIRRIRDLSNQDEQYNRFMKLVGGKMMTRSKSRDREHRKSTGKPGLDTSGNLYQYDNYDEVAMDTDSEPSSPVPSPAHSPLSADGVPQASLYVTDPSSFGLPFLSAVLPGLPPPPPPTPPPPDELEPPPKPPFADEEEEEEMLLRETCLMSMASKRVAVTEERGSSAPPSPSCQLTRGNLSTVSLNTVCQLRTNKFARGYHSPRLPLVLPRHKSVVVSLNDSDDSDSDMEACSSTQAVFGGLEFMIKEARRTVEATKPKGAEKENNPISTPEALPEAKKAEYRQLKEEIAREKQRTVMMDFSQGPPQCSISMVVESSGRAAAEVKLCEARQRLNKNRELLQRDEAVLRHFLQQELKKRESLKAAEAKVAKLREQLQASEKIVNANKTLLKKLQEQVHRVEHRVSLKKSLVVRLEQEVAQLAAGRGSKRRTDANQTAQRKLQRVDVTSHGSERHFAELIAQKQRLQQLESEYALKIQRLKETQALRNAGVSSELPAEPPPLQVCPPTHPQGQTLSSSSMAPLPQPSLHDLTQDKLTLDSEDVGEAEDHEPAPASAPFAPATAAAAAGPRRHSFRQCNSSFTKPNLEQLSSVPAKDTKPAKTTGSSSVPAEVFAGLDLDALRRRCQRRPQLGELLWGALKKMDPNMNINNAPAGKVASVMVETTTSRSVGAELRPVPFGPYRSPLLVFKSYRFSPYYRTKEKLSLSSVTYSNTIEPRKCFCRFDLTGTCNDDDCRWQHMRNCTLSGNQLFQDLLSYNLSLISCSESSSDEDIGVATEKYMKKLFGTNKDRMGVDQKAVLLVSKVNESKRHVPPFTTCKEGRRWRPRPSAQSARSAECDGEQEATRGNITPAGYDDGCKTSLCTVDVCVTSEDKRYFVSETDNISNLESSVLENPADTQLWIKLAYKYLNQFDTPAAESLEAALNTLSRALESNCDNPEVWSHYLSLFSRRGSREEVQEMCEMAVEHAPDYRVWWNYLNLESSFEGKDYICERLLHFLFTEASAGVTDKLSFQLMEALLYRVHLNVFTGRMENALAILQNALKSASEESIANHLTTNDRALVWLSYIHLTEFDDLPSSLYDPAESGPSRLVSTESYLLPWRTPQDISTPLHILVALFEDAICQCSDESLSPSERTLACLPLHTNLVFLNKLLQRYDEGIVMCESLLELCPESCALRDALADLHIAKGDRDRAVSMWLHALAECPDNAEVFYHSCKFLMAQDKSSAVVPLFRGFILSLCEDDQSQKKPLDVLRHILGFPTKELLRGPIIKKDLQDRLSQQTPYLHLVHCRWQWLHGSVEDALEAFERALGSAMQLEELHTLWMDYLVFISCQQSRGPTSSRSKRFSDLVQQCLSTVPSRLEVPFNPAEFWNCYRFHNKVISLYLSCLPQSQHALVLERLQHAMPNNMELSLRLLHQEWQDGSLQHVQFQASMLTSNNPKSLTSWKIAVAVETELKERAEVRLLYQQALQNLPLCAAMWKDHLLFEAAGGAPSERLRRLVDRCEQVGVSLVGGCVLGEDI